MMRRSWKEHMVAATRRDVERKRASVAKKGSITFDTQLYKEMGKPEAVVLLYERATRTIGVKPAHIDVTHAVVVRVRTDRSSMIVRSRSFFRDNGIELSGSLRIPFPHVDDRILILDLKTGYPIGSGG